MTRWTTPTDIRNRVRRRWNDGTILSALAANTSFPQIDVPLRGPRAGEIGDDLDAVRRWISDLESGGRAGSRYDLEYGPVGGRLIGRNSVPVRASVRSLEQACSLLGTRDSAQAYTEVLAVVGDEPDVRAWVAGSPLKALAVAESWPRLLAAYRWLRDTRGSRPYLREITAPGVDTKFVERHRGILASLLGVSSTATGFVAGLGLQAKPDLLRLRVAAALGPTPGLTDITAPVEELARLSVHARRALIVENEISFLSVPVPADGVVLWGKGFEVDRAASMPWLAAAEVDYWGDLDTHGFAILNQLRALLPQARSVLMDRATLLAHRERWVPEPAPTTAQLDRLTAEEAALYRDLVTDRFGERVRLEQERIDWSWALRHFPAEG